MRAQVEGFLRAKGWTLVSAAPDLDTRLAHPRIILPIVNHDDSQHAPNENLRLQIALPPRARIMAPACAASIERLCDRSCAWAGRTASR